MLDEKTQKQLIETGREFMKGDRLNDPYADSFESDQERKLPQPPLVKAPVKPENEWISLPMNFEELQLSNDLIHLIRDRRTARIYTQENMSLLQLSFLLWATQGVKSIRGKAYATLRTVPGGGARHEFETYLAIRKIGDLKPGIYHYLPMNHALEFLRPLNDPETEISDSLSGQTWSQKANVVFYWAANIYRCEWRYGIYAHRPALIDAGHVGQNLYLACTALGIGCCGVASFIHEKCCDLLGIDGKDEFVVYTAPVGTIRDQDMVQENMFYKFVEEQGL